MPPAEEDMIRDIDTLKLCGGMRRYYVMKTPMVRIIRGSLGLTNMDRERMKQDTAEDTHKVIGALAHLNIPRPPFLVEVSALCFHFHPRFLLPSDADLPPSWCGVSFGPCQACYLGRKWPWLFSSSLARVCGRR